MVDYTDDDLQRALGIVRGLGTAEGRPRLEELEDGLSIVDLQSSAEQFYNDLGLLEDFGLDFPALFLGGERPVPVALSEVMHGFFPIGPYYWRDFFRVPYLREQVYEELRRWRARYGTTTLSPDEARNIFISLASEFLASRFAGRRMAAAGGTPGQPPVTRNTFISRASGFLASRFGRRRMDDAGGPPPGQPPPVLSMPQFIGGPRTKITGCLFSVHTNTPGLSAYWSGAYLISSNYHGAPTTPAKGALQAGTYVFGVNGSAYGSDVQWDLNKVCTLPGTPCVKLDF